MEFEPNETNNEGKRGFWLNKRLIMEIIRYLIVGLIATIVDLATYYFFQNFILTGIKYSYMYATAFGFVVGLITNYLFSIFFVFKDVRDEKASRSLKSFIFFVVIGLIGLGISLLGMKIGELIFKDDFDIKIVNLLVRCFMTCVVLVWNYIARKLIIFK